jgi:hypothetical protein
VVELTGAALAVSKRLTFDQPTGKIADGQRLCARPGALHLSTVWTLCLTDIHA